MKIEIENWKPDINRISDNIRLGPQKDILNLVDDINARYICSTWIHGNRNYLPVDENVKPLGITPKFRFKAGYRKTIVDTILNRFHQYEKPGTLETMFNRSHGTEYSLKSFESKLLDLNRKMKNYRASGMVFQDNSEILKEAVNVLMNKINEQKESIKVINEDSNNNYTCDLDIYCADLDNLWGNLLVNQEDLTNEQIETIEWETAFIVFNIHIKKPKLRFVKELRHGEDQGCEDLGSMFVEDIHLSFGVNLQEWLNSLVNNNMDISSITANTFSLSRHGRQNGYSTSTALGLNTANLYKSGYYEGLKYSAGKRFISCVGSYHTTDRSLVMFPYIGNSTEGREYRTIVENDNLNHICFGDLDPAITQNILTLQFTDCLMFLPAWLTWNCNTSNPLNSIKQLTLVADKQLSKESWEIIGFDTFERHLRLCDMFGAHVPISESYNYRGRNSLEDSLLTQMNAFLDTWYDEIDGRYESGKSNVIDSLQTMYGYTRDNAEEHVNNVILINGLPDGLLQVILEHYINANIAMQEYVKDDCYYWKNTTRVKEFEEILDSFNNEDQQEPFSEQEETTSSEESLSIDIDRENDEIDRETREREMAIWVATRGGHNG